MSIFALTCPGLPPNEVDVVELTGREAMNDHYAVDLLVSLATLAPEAFTKAALGKRATAWIRHARGEARPIHGIVAAVSSEERAREGRHWVRARLVPKLWTLTLRQNSRIFQDLTVQQICDAILIEHQLAHVWQLGRSYAPRQYCVQYQETDEHFLRRILAEAGILFQFMHPTPASLDETGEEVLVLADSAQHHPTIAGDPRLVYRPHASGDAALQQAEDHVLAFRSSTVLTPSAVTLRDFDFRRPLLDLTASAGGVADTGTKLEIYDHHAEYDETDVGLEHAQVYLEQVQAERHQVEGAALCRRLVPGHAFTLSEHDLPDADGDWIVTAVEHEGRAGADQEYVSRFRAVRKGVPFRPPRPPRVLRQTQETALVVGPADHEVYVDGFGRIKVQFHWDRHGHHDAHSSCWIRVAQAWAGNGWGHQFIPRVGMEVLVSFLGGDQDRPVVTGCVNNALSPTPHGLPEMATRSGIRTRSVPGGGGSNEIAFEDKSGSELFLLNASKDFQHDVTVDRRSTIGRNESLTVRGDMETRVEGRRTEHIVGGQSTRVSGDGHVIVEGPLSLEARSTATLTTQGDASAHVGGFHTLVARKGSSVDVRGDSKLFVGGNHDALVSNDATSTVGGNAKLTVDGVATVNAADGLTVAVGTLREPRPAHFALSGGLALDSAGSIELNIQEEVRIQVGKTRLVLTRDSVRIESKTIEIDADTVLLNGGGAGVTLSGDVKISGGTVKASSKGGAVLELDGVAKLDGPVVHLRPGAAAESAARAKREEEIDKVEKETIVLYDRSGDPILAAPYEVSLPGYLDAGVAAAATIEIPKFTDVERCTVRWARSPEVRNAEPDAPVYEFETELYLITDHADPDETLRRKLHNMGFQARTLADSVSAFQLANGRDSTGVPDHVRAEVDALYAASRTVKRKSALV